ncbi:MAG: DNA mismatch repair endonuclease MutL [Nitrospirota bacterium]|nr:DNA mismatch repair endonuclease MutL [Nitrospirota bacterium]MDE3226607.1 DNA mismatch repair endonuclease MutL [Nitrospirota bacterium]MDE3242087.1 DNA mismatch repair endonuclease MutL [Nitrospirota bacterium]
MRGAVLVARRLRVNSPPRRRQTEARSPVNVVSRPGKIHILPGDVVSKIAAGEVVERPASVVRELVDNSLDAGATKITVEVRDGGRTLIKVTDDGEGMNREDAPLALQRHATSKVRSEQDLWSIRTLGFRGEALPSIASVSRLTLATATRDEPVGTKMVLTGGVLEQRDEAAVAPGTQIEVADLFFNTPARKKFLKATPTELSHVCQVVQQAALAWPKVRFRLLHNGQEVLDYPVAASLRDRLLQLYGQRWLEQVVEVRGEGPGLSLTGMTVHGAQTRAGRTPQELFVNRRAVKSPTVAHAIADGYGSFLAKGRYPQYVLFLDVDPGRVDVNVHPAKREVRFADQDLVHQTVRRAVRTALGGSPQSIRLDEPSQRPREQAAGWPGTAVGWQPQRPPTVRGEGPGTVAGLAHAMGSDAASALSGPEQLAVPGMGEASPAYLVETERDVVPLGQVSRTFLVAQVGTELQVIDQHTAHERVLFERLWRAWLEQRVVSQPLLIPEPIEVPLQRAPLLTRHLPELDKLGLSIEPFGAGSFMVRAVPAQLAQVDYVALVQDLVDDLSEWNAASSLESKVRPILATLACHSAVQAGRAMALSESKQLIEDWVREGLPMTCPHGRRVALRLTDEELNKIFGRA